VEEVPGSVNYSFYFLFRSVTNYKWTFFLLFVHIGHKLLQYPVKRYVGVQTVTSMTGGLHFNQLFHPVMLRGIGTLAKILRGIQAGHDSR
jgi:hypothetical protein